MVVQTSSYPFAPAKPRVPITPRRVSNPSVDIEKSRANKTHCPKCSARLHVTFEDAECINCGYVDYEYVAPQVGNTRKGSIISTGTRYVLRYIGEFPALTQVVTHVKVYRIRNRVVYGVSCPFCGSGMSQSSLSGKRREIREERYKCTSGHRVALCPDNKSELGWK